MSYLKNNFKWKKLFEEWAYFSFIWAYQYLHNFFQDGNGQPSLTLEKPSLIVKWGFVLPHFLPASSQVAASPREQALSFQALPVVIPNVVYQMGVSQPTKIHPCQWDLCSELQPPLSSDICRLFSICVMKICRQM